MCCHTSSIATRTRCFSATRAEQSVGAALYDGRVTVHVPNLRDVGGVSSDDGRLVRSGLLLRSALPAADDLVPEDFAWPPSVVIDLRSPLELLEGHPLDSLGAKVVNLPLLDTLQPGQHHEHDGTLASLYRQVHNHAAHLLVDLVTEIADADGPVLVHCAAGKDRTGIIAALLLEAVGVDRATVLDDYELTARYRARAHQEGTFRSLVERGLPPEAAAGVLTTPRWAMAEALDALDSTYAGIEAYLTGPAGLTPEELALLRDRLTTP